ncbi:hypothetical protein NC652_005173 [Populus alba x Populus x berolinensis]|uniref:Uncharacterized protein n=1 Tax=Populus alba x Populus x berolinensis TaxID=444605 RepID=A0AAD6WBG3_9ROSI|nr:hypothetical protein NC652_005173 [Populus alba x Populus x berolinensis]KAJ7005706.1 hypothetical protein NC653_005122 [Populus alba x Populus x berolinensis]
MHLQRRCKHRHEHIRPVPLCTRTLAKL